MDWCGVMKWKKGMRGIDVIECGVVKWYERKGQMRCGIDMIDGCVDWMCGSDVWLLCVGVQCCEVGYSIGSVLMNLADIQTLSGIAIWKKSVLGVFLRFCLSCDGFVLWILNKGWVFCLSWCDVMLVGFLVVLVMVDDLIGSNYAFLIVVVVDHYCYCYYFGHHHHHCHHQDPVHHHHHVEHFLVNSGAG